MLGGEPTGESGTNGGAEAERGGRVGVHGGVLNASDEVGGTERDGRGTFFGRAKLMLTPSAYSTALVL